MPLILHFILEAIDLLKKIPWKVWAVIGIVAAGLWWGHLRYEAGYAARDAEAVEQLIAANAAAEKQREELEARYEETVEKYIKERDEGYEKRDAIIASWQSGRLRLKPRFVQQTCYASGSDGGETTGLSDEDVQFLIRESARADAVVRQLTACQGIIKDGEETTK